MKEYTETVIRTLAERVENLEYRVKYKDEEIEKLEKELTEYKKAELLTVGFGKDE
jgi:uncharacterized coiled-coil protein SlyX